MKFTDFAFHPHIAAGIQAAGYTQPTPIQAQALGPVLAGHDVMGLAQTGTGKTAAFVLPILQRLIHRPKQGTRALIVAPTRELAEQTHQAIETLGRRTGLRSVTVYGGVSINRQLQDLKRGADIVVACPGRLLDHIGRSSIDLTRIEVLVIDEADQMLDMGFLPDIRRILGRLPQRRQSLLFSATMPDEIRKLAADLLTDPVTVQIGIAKPIETVQHALFPVAAHLKTPLLLKLLPRTSVGSVLVFTRTKHRAKRLGEQLARAGYRSASLQGNLSQNRRQAALDGFRDGTFQILVATDIAARGIDVAKVSHVINYDVPSTTDAYIHRIGRTGRASCSGDAFTLVTTEDEAMVRAIDRVLGHRVERRTLADFDYRLSPPRRDTEFARSPRPSIMARPGKPARQFRNARRTVQ
ncbi:MAG: DEAD/DEAH box helicase [Desulfobacteraceae bacterium]|jgi:ATP-dependent RNA helicase RhlE|nr:DEAD/DEAH box helicase [Desulfobacteraceae bacterium]